MILPILFQCYRRELRETKCIFFPRKDLDSVIRCVILSEPWCRLFYWIINSTKSAYSAIMVGFLIVNIAQRMQSGEIDSERVKNDSKKRRKRSFGTGGAHLVRGDQYKNE